MNINRQAQRFLFSAFSTVALSLGAALYPQTGIADWQLPGPVNEPVSGTTEHRDRRFREPAQ